MPAYPKGGLVLGAWAAVKNRGNIKGSIGYGVRGSRAAFIRDNAAYLHSRVAVVAGDGLCMRDFERLQCERE